MTKIIGSFELVGNYLMSDGKRYLISERKNVTGSKTKYFLIDKTTPKGAYISSLYEVANNTGIVKYKLEYQNITYELNINTDYKTATITEIEQKQRKNNERSVSDV